MNITNKMKSEIIDILTTNKILGNEYVENIYFSYKKQENFILPNSIVALENYVSNCSLCELGKLKKNSLFAKGNIFSRFYIIGLNYNYTDDKKFELLKNMVENVIDVNINNTYITNILKCNAIKSNNNYNKEAELCVNYLEKQITIGAPEIIITIGDAFDHMIKSKDKVTDVSGKLFSYNGTDLIPLMDPEFIYKNPSYKEKMYQDLKKIKIRMDEK